MSSGHLLAVDAGNSKTIAVVADGSGTVVGVERSGCGDIYGPAGELAAVRSVMAAIDGALKNAGITGASLSAGAFHLAGVDWPEDELFWRSVVDEKFAGVHTVVRNDGYALLRCADQRGLGVSATVGTGPAVAGRGRDGSEAIMGFWCQHAIGGAGLGEAALKTVALAERGMAPPTSLSSALLDLYREDTIEGLLHRFTRRGGPRGYGALAESARTVLAQAEAGDGGASDIVVRQATELVGYVAATARIVGLLPEGGGWPVVLGGSIMNSEHTMFRRTVLDTICKELPAAEVTVTTLPPVVGTLLDASALLGEEVAEGLRQRILNTQLPDDLIVT